MRTPTGRPSPRRLVCLAVALAVWPGARAAATVPANAFGVCPQAPQPEQEPNDTPATATPVTVQGFIGSSRSPGSIGTPGDVDVFRVAVPSGSRMSVLVDTAVLPPSPGSTTTDSVVEVLASNGTTVLEQDDDDGTGLRFGPVVSTEASAVAGLAVSGTVYVRVRAKDPGAVLSPYVLWVHLGSGPLLPEVEPNDTPATAVFLDPAAMGALSGPADVDWYRRVLLGGGPHGIIVDGDPERDGTVTDVRIDFEPGPSMPPMINSSVGAGSPPPGAEMVFLGGGYAAIAPAFRLSGPAAGTYSVSLLYIGGDACQVPVELRSFEVR